MSYAVYPLNFLKSHFICSINNPKSAFLKVSMWFSKLTVQTRKVPWPGYLVFIWLESFRMNIYSGLRLPLRLFLGYVAAYKF